MITLTRPDLAIRLIQHRPKVVQSDPRQLRSHQERPSDPLSPVYFEFDKASDPLVREVASMLAYLAMKRAGSYGAVVGVPHAANRFAAVIAKEQRVPQYFLDKVVEDGKRRICARPGEPLPQCTALVVEDVLTTGGSSVAAIDALTRAGATATHVVAVIDREQGGRTALASRGISCLAIWRMRELLDFWSAAHLINPDWHCRILAYLDQFLAGQTN